MQSKCRTRPTNSVASSRIRPAPAPRSFEPAPSDVTPRPDPFVPLDDEPERRPADPSTIRRSRTKAARPRPTAPRSSPSSEAHTLNQVNLGIAVTGKPGEDFPYECSIDDGTWYTGRCWDETTYMWKASALCHKPLYFEDEALERYGHSWGPYLDPFVSGAHFFCKLPVLPYCMGVTPPTECMYALGHYRPGNCAPYMINPVPISLRGAAFEAAPGSAACSSCRRATRHLDRIIRTNSIGAGQTQRLNCGSIGLLAHVGKTRFGVPKFIGFVT